MKHERSAATQACSAESVLRREIERLRRHVSAVHRVPKLLVMDLNGLLVHRVFLGAGESTPSIDSSGAVPKARVEPYIVNGFAVYERPHARDFLRFCLERFVVGFWSTAAMHNIVALLERLLTPEEITQLLFIWDGKRCTYTGGTDPARPGKPIAYKNLQKLWDNPQFGGLYGAHNTVLLDDSPEKASLNPEYTAVHPEGWDDPEAKANDALLAQHGKLRRYLDALSQVEIMNEFLRSQPYSTFPDAVRRVIEDGRIADCGHDDGFDEGGDEIVLQLGLLSVQGGR